MKSINWASTGISGLDRIINNLRKGDNVVWQVNDIIVKVFEFSGSGCPLLISDIVSQKLLCYLP
jgi:hypothetical protein